MTPSRFAALGCEVFGGFGWKSRVARASGVHRSTVLRWAAGEIPIPPEVAEALEKEAGQKVRTIQALVAE